jgi:hypothetical protein
MKVNSESFIWQRCPRLIDVWEKMTSYLKVATVQEKAMCVLGFSKQSPLSKRNVVTELSTEKIHLKIMLSDVG